MQTSASLTIFNVINAVVLVAVMSDHDDDEVEV